MEAEPRRRFDGTLRVTTTVRCHMLARTTAGDMTTGGTALITVKLRAGNMDDDAAMWHMPERAHVTCICTIVCTLEKTADLGKISAQAPDVNETATGSMAGRTSESEIEIEDCRRSCDTEPTYRLLPEARATACVSCTAAEEGAGVAGPGACTHSSQGNTIATDMQDGEEDGQPEVKSDESG